MTGAGVDREYQRQVEFLTARGAADIRHSRGTLLAHLCGTRELLAAWGNDADTCAAGLFHSVYGTYVFDHALVESGQRDAVRAAIGERAEALVWLFGASDRRTFFAAAGADGGCLRLVRAGGAMQPVDVRTLARLIEIEVADTVEQLPRRKPHRQLEYEWYREAFEDHLDRLSAGAIAAFRRAFAAAQAARAASGAAAGAASGAPRPG